LELGPVALYRGRLWGTIRQTQEGAAYPLAVAVQVTTAEGAETHLVRCRSPEAPFVLEPGARPRALELDPDYHLFRALPRRRVGPCLEGVRTAPRRVGFGDDALLKALDVESVEPSLPLDAAVLAVGLPPAVRGEVLQAARRQEASLQVEEGRFSIRGEAYDRPGDALLFSYHRSGAPGLPVTFFWGNGPAAYTRTRYLPYYAMDGWVVFRDGLPVARGVFDTDPAARAQIPAGAERDPGPLVRDLLWLTDAARGGRRADGGSAVAGHLAGRLSRAGFSVQPWPPVEVPVTRIVGPRTITLLGGTDPTRIEDAFFPFHRSAVPEGPVEFGAVVEHADGDAAGNLVLLPEDAAEETAGAAAAAGAAAVAVVASEPELGRLGERAAWPGALPPKVAARLRARGGDPVLATTGAIARARTRRLAVPYVYLRPAAAAALRSHRRGGVLRWRTEVRSAATAIVVGALGGTARPGVLLSAHWDGVGRIGGAAAPGAADNAAGVAVVLRVAARLREDHEAGRLRRPVIVALFGGEEMGLLGSSQFARLVRSERPPLPPPAAAVNVDGIGNHPERKLYLVGRSHSPALFERFEAARAGSGLDLGKDIDRFAFRLGSDHWPLHRAGIPAVTVYSADYKSMNTSADTVDRIDLEAVRRIAGVVYRMVRSLAAARTLEGNR
ncbi:MAG: M28 family metallopeptidase, partial [Planctomycetota bacterium]